MTPDLLHAAADSNQWWAITPELLLGGGALFLLVAEIVLPRQKHGIIPKLAVLVQVAALLGVLMNFHTSWIGESTFAGLLRHSLPGQIARLFFLTASLLTSFLASICLPRTRMPRVEFYHILMVVTAAMMLLAQSDHFAMLFVALETVTIGFYILVSYFRDNALTLEAGLKYLVMGALSSAILLFGIVLLYGAVGRVDGPNGAVHTGFEFRTVADFLRTHPDNFLAITGMLLVLSGVAFKIGAFPFQIWIPDVYQGAPTPVTAFLAVASKAAGFAVLLTLVNNVFSPLSGLLIPVLSMLAGATIIFGNFSALTQRNAKRLMGLSGVSHAGFLLMGVIASLQVGWAAGAVWFYLFTYMLASMAVFGVMAHLAGPDDTAQELEDYDLLAREQPLLAGVLVVGIGSLAGIPPLAGFIGKLLVFLAAFQAHLYGLLAVAVAGVVVSIYYYFGWIKAAFFETGRSATDSVAPTASRPSPTVFGTAVLSALATATVLLGFFQEPLTRWLSLK